MNEQVHILVYRRTAAGVSPMLSCRLSITPTVLVFADNFCMWCFRFVPRGEFSNFAQVRTHFQVPRVSVHAFPIDDVTWTTCLVATSVQTHSISPVLQHKPPNHKGSKQSCISAILRYCCFVLHLCSAPYDTAERHFAAYPPSRGCQRLNGCIQRIHYPLTQ